VDPVDVAVSIEASLLCDPRLVKPATAGSIAASLSMDGTKSGKSVDHMPSPDRILLGCGRSVMCGESHDGSKGWVVNLILL
jgi:hypothetical protein